MKRVNIVFYGTLIEFADSEESCNLLYEGELNGTMVDLGSFPAVTDLGTDNTFFAKVYSIPSSMLPELDRYEGVPQKLYSRETIEIEDIGEAFIYVLVPTTKWQTKRKKA